MAKVDITPDRPVPLAGFAFRTGLSDGIGERLTLRALALSSTRHPDRAVVLCCADLIWWGSDLVPVLRAGVARRFGRRVDLLLHASHTHSGPQTSGLFTPGLGLVDHAYLDRLSGLLYDAVGRALSELEPVTLTRADGTCDIAQGRRGRPEGAVQPAEPVPDVHADVDRDLVALRFRGPGGRTRAVLVHYACHPVVNGTRQLSADFPGAAVREIEDNIGDGAVAAFLQGGAGDVNPDLVRHGAFVRGGSDEVSGYGRRLASAVMAALAGPSEPVHAGDVGLHRRRLTLRLQRPPTRSQLKETVGRDDVIGDWARLLLANPERLRAEVALHLGRLDLGPDLALVSMDAEPVTAYARFVKTHSRGGALPLGYTDGMVGYLVTADQLAEGGYEPLWSTRYFGLPAPLSPDAQDIVLQSLVDLVAPASRPARHLYPDPLDGPRAIS